MSLEQYFSKNLGFSIFRKDFDKNSVSRKNSYTRINSIFVEITRTFPSLSTFPMNMACHQGRLNIFKHNYKDFDNAQENIFRELD